MKKKVKVKQSKYAGQVWPVRNKSDVNPQTYSKFQMTMTMESQIPLERIKKK